MSIDVERKLTALSEAISSRRRDPDDKITPSQWDRYKEAHTMIEPLTQEQKEWYRSIEINFWPSEGNKNE